MGNLSRSNQECLAGSMNVSISKLRVTDVQTEMIEE